MRNRVRLRVEIRKENRVWGEMRLRVEVRFGVRLRLG